MLYVIAVAVSVLVLVGAVVVTALLDDEEPRSRSLDAPPRPPRSAGGPRLWSAPPALPDTRSEVRRAPLSRGPHR